MLQCVTQYILLSNQPCPLNAHWSGSSPLTPIIAGSSPKRLCNILLLPESWRSCGYYSGRTSSSCSPAGHGCGRCKGGPIEDPGYGQSRPVGPRTSHLRRLMEPALLCLWCVVGLSLPSEGASSPLGAGQGRSPAAMPKEGPLLALKLSVCSSSLLPHSPGERAGSTAQYKMRTVRNASLLRDIGINSRFLKSFLTEITH